MNKTSRDSKEERKSGDDKNDDVPKRQWLSRELLNALPLVMLMMQVASVEKMNVVVVFLNSLPGGCV
jgi:hypothetical protein